MELSRMSWADAREQLHQARVGLLPVGSTEQHGPHLPLGTDHLTAAEVTRRTAARGDWLVLPVVPVGVSEHHRQFWGTLWVEPAVLRDYVLGIARSLASHGLHRLVFVNGHGGNSAALDEAARILRHEGVFAFVFSWWRAIPELIANTIETGGSHAGEMETSAVLAFAPQLVNSSRYREALTGAAPEWGKRHHGIEIGFDTLDFSRSGATGDPTPASADKGNLLLEAAAERLDAFCRWLAEEPDERLRARPHLP
ncbi:MAG: Creatinine amidohydrolase [Candidatus Bipolaricaulis sibiricus]|uniref:Creatinine amidohydrolase n=1 Tax=Bipolaricaulis sibiricus TaxID=2501609 RepID=A0A410FSS8_BIPS1|nr:MAG: Creatinine amidohydrolase [Candidatus Bipolaricaulis sibiricus]